MANLPSTSIGVGAFTITPSDSTDLAQTARSLWIGGAGSGGLKVDLADGSTVTFAGVGTGIFPFAVKRVYATGTDVTAIIGVK